MKTPAYLNYGRWVVDCPHFGCHGAMKVIVGTTRIECNCQDDLVCEHGDVCSRPIEPLFPDDSARIMEIVAQRPRRANRNWLPGETAVDLVAENVEHMVEVF